MRDVRNDAASSRFVLEENGATAFAAYERDGDAYVFTHTEVPETLEGRGVGTRLIEGALDQVRAEGARVVPLCSFVRRFIDTHAGYADLVA